MDQFWNLSDLMVDLLFSISRPFEVETANRLCLHTGIDDIFFSSTFEYVFPLSALMQSSKFSVPTIYKSEI